MKKRSFSSFVVILIGCLLLLVPTFNCNIEEELQSCEDRIDAKIRELQDKVDNQCISRDEVINILVSVGYSEDDIPGN